MPGLGWLDVSDLDFNVLLLLEPLHAVYMAQRQPDAAMGTAIGAHPAVRWYLGQIHPPTQTYLDRCLALANRHPTAEELRRAELAVLDTMQDWLIYILDPAQYDQLKFLNWDDDSLLTMADFSDRVVLDVGAGSGRLAFTVAPYARAVYAVEPVANLRCYLWEKRTRLGFDNVFPIDGLITRIPFEDNFADILMAGHVFGDDFDAEYAEMQRVVRPGGLILLHPGTNASSETEAHKFLLSKGFAFAMFEEPGDGLKRKYWLKLDQSSQSKEKSYD